MNPLLERIPTGASRRGVMKFKLDENLVVIRTPVNPSLAVLERMVAQLREALARLSGDHFAAIQSGGPG